MRAPVHGQGPGSVSPGPDLSVARPVWDHDVVHVGRKAAVQAVQELIESHASSRRALRENELALKRALTRVERGEDVASAITSGTPADSRKSLNDALAHLEQKRRTVRLMVFAMALDSGMSVGDLGKAWGISRQMAARYAKEARSVG